MIVLCIGAGGLLLIREGIKFIYLYVVLFQNQNLSLIGQSKSAFNRSFAVPVTRLIASSSCERTGRSELFRLLQRRFPVLAQHSSPPVVGGPASAAGIKRF